MIITFSGKKESVVASVAELLPLVDDCALTLTIKPKHQEGYYAQLVIDDSDGGLRILNGSEPQQTTSMTHPSETLENHKDHIWEDGLFATKPCIICGENPPKKTKRGTTILPGKRGL